MLRYAIRAGLEALAARAMGAAEVDWAGCQVMYHSLDDVRQLRVFVESSGVDLGAIDTIRESIDGVKHSLRNQP